MINWYAKAGARKQPFHLAMMVKVLIYGYATGIFSSRKLATRLHEDVALGVLAAENYPAHRTLSDFPALHLQELGAGSCRWCAWHVSAAWSSWRPRRSMRDIPCEIKRREDRLAAITVAKLRLDQRQQEADVARGSSKDDECQPRENWQAQGGRYKRDCGVPRDSARESFSDTQSRITPGVG